MLLIDQCIPVILDLYNYAVNTSTLFSTFLYKGVETSKMYADKPWNMLELNEQKAVVEDETDHINSSTDILLVSKAFEHNYGVFTKQWIKKKELITYYAGEILTASQVKHRYSDILDASYLFEMISGKLYVDAVDPRKSNIARFINCPGVKERPNCIVSYNQHTRQLQIKTCRILVPGEQLTVSYGRCYVIDTDRRQTDNKTIRKKWNLRGKRNVNISDFEFDPPLSTKKPKRRKAIVIESSDEETDTDTNNDTETDNDAHNNLSPADTDLDKSTSSTDPIFLGGKDINVPVDIRVSSSTLPQDINVPVDISVSSSTLPPKSPIHISSTSINSNSSSDFPIKQTKSTLTSSQSSRLPLIKKLLNRMSDMERNLAKFFEIIGKIHNNTDLEPYSINSVNSITPISTSIDKSDKIFVPHGLKRSMVDMFRSDGSLVTDNELQKKSFWRRKRQCYSDLTKNRPDLFKNPNDNLPKTANFIDNLSEMITDDSEDPFYLTGSELSIGSSTISSESVLSSKHPFLSYYFPDLDSNSIQDILNVTQEQSLPLDELIRSVEDEIFNSLNKTKLFSKWLADDVVATEIINWLSTYTNLDKTVALTSKEQWMLKNFKICDNGMLWKINHIKPTMHGIKTQPFRDFSKYIPNRHGLQETIMRHYHGTVSASHPGKRALTHMIRSRYYWPSIHKSCSQWVLGCDLCRIRKTHRTYAGLNYSVRIANWPMQYIYMDFVHGLPVDEFGNNCVVCAVCAFSGYPMVNAAELILEIQTSFPFQIQYIVSNKGGAFTGGVLKILCEEYNINIRQTSTVSPLGGIENFNKYLLSCLTLLILKPERRLNWRNYINPVLSCFRSSVSASHGYSPFRILYGLDSIKQIDVMLENEKENMGQPNQSDYRQQEVEIYKDIRIIRQRSQVLQSVYKNLGHSAVSYEPNDIISIWRTAMPGKIEARKVIGRVVYHQHGQGSLRAKVKVRGSWIEESVRVQNCQPYYPYSTEYFTSAPEDFSITKEPPTIYDNDPPVAIPKPIVSRPARTESELPVYITIGSQCSVHDFVVIPALFWNDIQRDRLDYSIAKCVEIRMDEENHKYGIFIRYGNYSGKVGNSRPIYPGWIDPKDMKYVYQSSKSQSRYVPYTNDLSHVKLHVALKKIYLADIPLCFPELTSKHCVPPDVQQQIDKIFVPFNPTINQPII